MQLMKGIFRFNEYLKNSADSQLDSVDTWQKESSFKLFEILSFWYNDMSKIA